jgi:RNA ligase
MRYEFPKIRSLDDVLPAIEGLEEFFVARKDGYIVVNYMVTMSDTFPAVENEIDAIRRECRGILFYPDGRIMSRRLHKFFNVNERDETQFNSIDWNQPHVILEKLDGSMITPVVLGGTKNEFGYTVGGYIRWGTKMGITDVSMGAEEFVARNPNYAEFARWCIDYCNSTPIFEWCSRKQRIVVDYPEDRLVLIAVREKESGRYQSYEWMQTYADQFDIDLIKTYKGDAISMAHLMEETRDSNGIEGYIVRFDDGHMLKIKGEWYLRIHKVKDSLTHEKNVIELLTSGRIDDVKSFMLDEDRKRINEFEYKFWQGIHNVVEKYENYFQTVIVEQELDRKTWALNYMPKMQKDDPFISGIIFGKFDNKDVRSMVLDIIKKNCGTQTKVNAARNLWGGYSWSYNFDGDT